MPAKRFNEADIDFDAIDGELAKLVPPKLSLADVLDRLRKRLIEQQAKGVTVAQMHEVLKSGGIDITERSLRTFLDKGVLPGRKVAEAARSMVSEEGSDPFWSRTEVHVSSQSKKAAFEEWRSVVAVFAMQIMKAMGDGRALAWRFSARLRQWPKRRADRWRCIVRKNEEPPASVSSHGWRWLEAPRHGLFL